MCISHEQRPEELDVLIRRFQERRGATRLKARALKGLVAELNAVYALGLPWKEIWRTLRDVGYEGSYRQFVAMTNQLMSLSTQKVEAAKDLPSPLGEKGTRNHVAGNDAASTDLQEKPEWQIRREETMARLDREAEQNREREARLSRPKVFNPPPFVGRGDR